MSTAKKPNAGATAWETRKRIHGATGKARPIATSPLLYWKARAEKAEAALVEALQIAATLRQLYEDKYVVMLPNAFANAPMLGESETRE